MAEKLNINDLVEIVNEKTGKSLTAADARVHLRKLAKDGEIEKREGRWSFEGKNDPAIKGVVARVKAGKPARKGKPMEGEEDYEEAEEKPASKKAPRKKAPAKKAPSKKSDTIDDEDDLEVDIEDI